MPCTYIYTHCLLFVRTFFVVVVMFGYFFVCPIISKWFSKFCLHYNHCNERPATLLMNENLNDIHFSHINQISIFPIIFFLLLECWFEGLSFQTKWSHKITVTKNYNIKNTKKKSSLMRIFAIRKKKSPTNIIILNKFQLNFGWLQFISSQYLEINDQI